MLLKMKKIVALLITSLMFQCKKDVAVESVVVDTYVNVSVMKNGKDMLNPNTVGGYDLASIKLAYTDDLGNNMAISTAPLLYEVKGSVYYLRIFAGADLQKSRFIDKQNIKIVWSDNSVDLVHLNLYQSSSNYLTKSILINNKEVWNVDAKVEKNIVITK